MSIIVTSAILLSCVILSVYVLFYSLPQSAIDTARNNLFVLRDELFAMGEMGLLQFDSKIYIMHRTLLNGMIRYSDDISLSHMLITKHIQTQAMKEISRRVAKAVDADVKSLPPETRKQLAKIINNAHIEMVMLMINRSVFLTITMRTLWVCSLLANVMRSTCKALAPHLDSRQISTVRKKRIIGAQVAPVANQRAFRVLKARTQASIDRNSLAFTELACA